MTAKAQVLLGKQCDFKSSSGEALVLPREAVAIVHYSLYAYEGARWVPSYSLRAPNVLCLQPLIETVHKKHLYVFLKRFFIHTPILFVMCKGMVVIDSI
ncbi:hypothetical protein GGR09_000600 [Bartonella heixiaziensis]